MRTFITQMLLIFICLHVSSIPHGARSLKLEKLEVPSVVVEGEAAVLTCPFNLDSVHLYSVMWYKDHEEFYRYVPKNVPKQHSYLMEGFQIDMQMSNDRQVYLSHVTLKASGMYRCEVSAEAPSFTSVHDEARMEVISIPEEDPEISGQQAEYNVGDVMTLNCTSGKSYPPAKLEWFINDALISPDSKNLSEDSGLVSSTTRLNLRLEPHHFSNGQMTVRCVATVGPVQSSTRISPLLVNHKETSLLVQARGSSASSLDKLGWKWSWLICFLSLV